MKLWQKTLFLANLKDTVEPKMPNDTEKGCRITKDIHVVQHNHNSTHFFQCMQKKFMLPTNTTF